MAMTNFIGLGPPDLVVLEKNYTPPKLLIGAKQSKHSYFHWTLGNDVSSSAAVATYLGFLLENQDKSSFGKGVFSIDKCYNCSYNAFRKMDLRVEIIVPEPARKHNGFGIDAYAVDAVGNRHEVDELFWKETHVCAMLRLIEGPPVALRPIKIKDALNDPLAESTFLNFCVEVFPQGRKLGNPENGYSLYGIDASNNLLTTILCKYFIQHNRFEHMLGFFDNFTNIDPVVSVPISYAEAMLDRSPRALTLLDSSLRRKPDSSSIMLSLAELNLLKLPIGLDRHIKLLDTLKTALNGIALQPNLARGWWILSKCLIEMGRYEWSLVVMNNAPVVNEDFAERLVDSYGNPHFEKFTNPELFVNHILTIMQDEENNFREEGGDASLRLLAAPTISPDEKTVYALLSDIISRSSWDHLTKIRTRVLVRPADMEKAKSRFLKSELSSSSISSTSASTSSAAPSNIVPTTEQQQLQEQPHLPAQPFIPPASVNASSMAREREEHEEREIDREVEIEKEDSVDQKDDSKSAALYQSTDSDLPSNQQSAEFSPMQRETRRSLEAEEDKKETVEQPTDLRQTQELLASSLDSTELQDVSIGNDKQFVAPSFSIARDLDVDDALTKFLVYVIANRNGVPVAEVPTTPMNIEVASSPMIPVKEISRNVDVAFHAIFQDIKAFHAWKEEEKKLNLMGSEDLPPRLIPARTVADWIRIANMCERLSFSKDAAKIYKMLEHSHYKALQAIVGLDAERGDIKSTLLDASNLLARYSHPSISSSSPPSSVPGPSPASSSSSSSANKITVQQPHPVVVNAIVKLIASQGAHKVRNMQSSMPYLHPLLPPVVQNSVRWKSKGFDM